MRRFSKKQLLIGVGIFLAVIIIGFILRASIFYSGISTARETWEQKIPKEKKTFTILMMGYGGAGHEGAFLTDTMMLAHIDIEKKRALVISIPRDIWINIPTDSGDDFYRKVNSAYQIGLFKDNYPDVPNKYEGEQGAGDLIKEIVAKIVGFPVDYYVAIDFEGFRKAVDTLGGVDVNVEKSFTDPLYPIEGHEEDLCGISPDDEEKFDELEKIATESPELAFPCRYETLHFDRGVQYMDGETALKFVRSRHALEDGGDFGRARRQQLFLESTRDKVLSIGFISKVIPLLDDLQNNIRTDMPLDLVKKFIKEFPKSSEYEIEQIVLTTDNYLQHSISFDGQYILIPEGGIDKWRPFQRDVLNIIEDISPTPEENSEDTN